MTKKKVYRYLGRNGIVNTPVLIEGTTPITMYRLIADANMMLTNGISVTRMIDVFGDELDDWYEIPKPAEE